MVKHIIGGLYYHFWTKAWPENVAMALTFTDLEHMSDRSKKLISGAMNGIERFVNMALIATGLLQILALRHAERIFQLQSLVDANLPQGCFFGGNGEDRHSARVLS